MCNIYLFFFYSFSVRLVRFLVLDRVWEVLINLLGLEVFKSFLTLKFSKILIEKFIEISKSFLNEINLKVT